MENFYILNITQISKITYLLAIIVFILTFIIKLPIKKKTKSFCEEKRKAINSFIILIPLTLSITINILYFYFTSKELIFNEILKYSINTYVIDTIIYAFYSRLQIIIKGIKTNENLKISYDNKSIDNNSSKIINNNNQTVIFNNIISDFYRLMKYIKRLKK